MGMFERDQQVFADAAPLDDSYEPEDIRERDDELEKYQRALQPIIDNRPTSNIFLYGKTGTGKTVATKFMLSHLESDAGAYDDVDLSTVWVSCENLSSSYQVAVALVNELRRGQGQDRISTTGYSQQRVFDLLYEELDSLGGTVVIVLDEIDNIGQSDDILYGLPRARSNDYVDDVRPVIVGISNDFQFRENLSPKVKDTLAEKEILFPPYDANQLRSILRPRAEKAFHDGVLNPGVIPKTAALAAQRHGDARKAIRLLRHAGDYAKNNNIGEVREDHLELAQEQAEVERLKELIAGLPPHSKYVLYALANLTKETDDGDVWFRTTVIYDIYTKVCEAEGTDTLTTDTIRGLLSELAFLEVTESNQEHGGMGKGTYKEHRLLWEPSVVFKMDPDPAHVDIEQ